LKKAQCLRKLGRAQTEEFIYYDDMGYLQGIWLELEEKKIEDIKKHLNIALKLLPNMPEAFMQLGLLNVGNYQEKAINLFTKAIEQKPDYAAAFNNRAMVFYPLIYASILTNSQQDKDYFEKAKRSNFINAVADLTEAIRIRPFDAIYHLNRGTFYSKLVEHKEAVEDFSSALSYASSKLKDRLQTDVLVFTLRGKEYLELKEYGKAIGDFSETLCSKPEDSDTLLLRGKAYFLAGEKDKAKADFEEYLNRKRKDANDAGRNEINKLIGFKPEDI
jgi:tetratricopeptide (TPR) repeat protein